MANRTSKHRRVPPASSTQPPPPMSGGLKVAVVIICVVTVLLFALMVYKGKSAQARIEDTQAQIAAQREQMADLGNQVSQAALENSELLERIESGEVDPEAVARDRLGLSEEDTTGEIMLEAE